MTGGDNAHKGTQIHVHTIYIYAMKYVKASVMERRGLFQNVRKGLYLNLNTVLSQVILFYFNVTNSFYT